MHKITLINASGNTDYLFGLVSGLNKLNKLSIELIDSDRSKGLFNNYKNIININLRGDYNPNVFFINKLIRVIKYYIKLINYSLKTESSVFHIQWLNKFYFIDRTILLIYYKILGKKVLFTAHNVDDYGRIGQKSTLLNRMSLKFFYKYVNHIICHTIKSKNNLVNVFNISKEKISVIPMGINNKIQISGLNKLSARYKLNIDSSKKIILFFGRFEYYKGADILIEAFHLLVENDNDYYLIIAGYPSEKNYVNKLVDNIYKYNLNQSMSIYIKYLDDNEIDLIMSATDCIILPYRDIYQSGVLFLGYSFGIPIIASDVGNFKNDIIENFTGYIYKPNNPDVLKNTILKFFKSNLYLNKKVKDNITTYANKKYNWDNIAFKTFQIYKRFLNEENN